MSDHKSKSTAEMAADEAGKTGKDAIDAIVGDHHHSDSDDKGESKGSDSKGEGKDGDKC